MYICRWSSINILDEAAWTFHTYGACIFFANTEPDTGHLPVIMINVIDVIDHMMADIIMATNVIVVYTWQNAWITTRYTTLQDLYIILNWTWFRGHLKHFEILVRIWKLDSTLYF